MKSVLISIRPEWCELILAGKKTLEVRKTMPRLGQSFKVYIYCTKSKKGWFNFKKKKRLDGKVIGEFICDGIRAFDVPYPAFQNELDKTILEQSCLTYYQLHRYAYHDCLYAWHISDLVIYDEPKALDAFFRACDKSKGTDCSVCIDRRENKCKAVTRPPQSWCYVEELQDGK